MLFRSIVKVSVTGLGSLENRIAAPTSENAVAKRIPLESHLGNLNLEKTAGGSGLTCLGEKQINLRKVGTGPEVAVFVHGLGSSSEYFTPIIKGGGFEDRYTSYVYDLEGHGLSPTNVASVVTIESFADDLANVVAITGASSITLFAHSLGCVIATAFTLRDSKKIKKLILMGPAPCPLPEAGQVAMGKRAAAVRENGMMASGIADAVSDAGTSNATKVYQPVAYTAVRASLLSTNPEGYAKACTALKEASAMEVEKLTMPVFLVTGDEDKTSPPQVVTDLHQRIPDSRMEVLRYTGHWHVYENPEGISRLVKFFA